MLGLLTADTATALLSPSARVLVAAAHADGGASVAGALPWRDVHWPTLLALISYERAESQVLRVMQLAPAGAVPAEMLQATRNVARVAAFRNAELGAAALAAQGAFDRAGIECVWLKGAALAMQSDAGFGLRSMGDLDVLVRSAALAEARAVLREVGWSGGETDSSYAEHHHDTPMVGRAGVRLELHTGLFMPGHPFADEAAEVWFARSRPVVWQGGAFRVLTTVWHVVHASVHWAWSHEGATGSWQYLHDMHRLTAGWQTGGDAWEQVAAAAAALGAERPVGWGLWSAARLAELRNAESVIDRLRGPVRGMVGGLTEREWVVRAFHSPAASPSVRWSWYWWRRAMCGLGDSGERWPWALGRGAVSVPPHKDGERTSSAVPGLRDRSARWRRHLLRVLSG